MPRKRAVLGLVRVVVGVGLLVLLISRMDTSEVFSSLSNLSLGLLTLAIAAQLVAKIFWTFRWQAILATCGERRSFRDLLALVFIGLFFNLFLPTGMGGDFFRGYYSARPGGSASASPSCWRNGSWEWSL